MKTITRPEFNVDDDVINEAEYDKSEEDDRRDVENGSDEHGSVCGFCDDGGDMLWYVCFDLYSFWLLINLLDSENIILSFHLLE